MKIHVGNPCFCCGRILTEEDTIVVCPDCGTPYHKECWNKEVGCINLPLHETKSTWKPASEEKTPSLRCARCGTENIATANFCVNCGMPFQEAQNRSKQSTGEDRAEGEPGSFQERMEKRMEQMQYEDPYQNMNPDQDLEGERLGDVADYVKTNQRYFLPRFLYLQKGHRILANFPCLLFPQYYFAFRKMWGLSLILVIVIALLGMPQMLCQLPEAIASMKETGYETLLQSYPEFSEALERITQRIDTYETLLTNLSTICTFLQFCIKIVFGLLGNWIYYRHVLKRVHQVKQEDVSLEMRRFRMQQEGGTNPWLILATAGIGYVAEVVLCGILLMFLMA